MKKIKQHVLMVSKRFPHYHKRKGELTWFEEKIFLSQTTPPGTLVRVKDLFGKGAEMDFYPKLHTCREGYDRWKHKIHEVNRGEAVLVLKYWSGRPYHSSPVELMRLSKGQVGIQEIIIGWVRDGRVCQIAVDRKSLGGGAFGNINDGLPIVEEKRKWFESFVRNDGFVDPNDFGSWFRRPGLHHLINPPEPMALIHFTNFRY